MSQDALPARLQLTIDRVVALARDVCEAQCARFIAANGQADASIDLGVRLDAPVTASDGAVVGTLVVAWRDARLEDMARMARRLANLAALIANDYERLTAADAMGTALENASVMVASVPLSLMMTDNETRLLAATPRWLADFGVGRDEAIGKTLYAFDPAHFTKFRPMFERCLGGETVRVGRLRLPDLDGVDHWLQAELTPWRDRSGQIGGMIGAAIDITDTVEALERSERAERALIEAKQAAESANLAKSVFLATMSHEIRTPLNGVLGMAQAMAVDELTPVQRERLEVVRQSGAGLLAILNDVLDMAKIEAGKLELEAIEFDLDSIVGATRSTFQTLSSNKGLAFAIDYDEAARGRYLGDPNRLRQILCNLVSNALKFTEQGQVRLSVAWDGANLSLSVADTGIGISEGELDRLFGRFTQADTSTTRRFGGTGLGLAICRELSTLMGGSLEVKSQAGHGSTFTARLPMVRVGPAVSEAAAPPPTMPGRAIRVLAAEDNAVNQLVLKTLLNQIGVEPVFVENGVQAIEAWRAAGWDVILMDIQMPLMDGVEATRAIRQLESAQARARTPIIALTANAMAHQADEYQACGMDARVAKPIEVARLYEALEQVIESASRDIEAEDRSAA